MVSSGEIKLGMRGLWEKTRGDSVKEGKTTGKRENEREREPEPMERPVCRGEQRESSAEGEKQRGQKSVSLGEGGAPRERLGVREERECWDREEQGRSRSVGGEEKNEKKEEIKK